MSIMSIMVDVNLDDDYKCFISDIMHNSVGYVDSYYIETVMNYEVVFYAPAGCEHDLLMKALERSKRGVDIHFGPTLRKRRMKIHTSNYRNIILPKCYWVNIDNPDSGLNFEQRRNEAEILLAGFRKSLKQYDLDPSYIVSNGYSYTVYFYCDEPLVRRISKWMKIQTALTKMAKINQPAEDITGLVRLPGTFNYEDYDNRQEVKIIHAGLCRPYPEIDYDTNDIQKRFDDCYYDKLISKAQNKYFTGLAKTFQRIAKDYL